jgi:hypothetical protein
VLTFLDNSSFAVKALGPESWRPVPIFIPSTPESWLVVGCFAALFSLSIWLMLHRPVSKPQLRVRKRIDNWTEEYGAQQWNVVQLRSSDAKKYWPERYAGKGSSHVDKLATLRINSKSVACRILINNRAPEGELLLHEQLFEQFDSTFDKIGNAMKHQDGSMTVNVEIFTPIHRPDLMTVFHPDPDLRMQWRLGIIFLVLGVIIPEIIRSVG